MKMHIPNTSLNIESKKIEQVVITGPSMAEAMDYCAKHGLKISNSGYEMGETLTARVEASRDVQLVEV